MENPIISPSSLAHVAKVMKLHPLAIQFLRRDEEERNYVDS